MAQFKKLVHLDKLKKFEDAPKKSPFTPLRPSVAAHAATSARKFARARERNLINVMLRPCLCSASRFFTQLFVACWGQLPAQAKK
jgi:hypothetical protein